MANETAGAETSVGDLFSQTFTDPWGIGLASAVLVSLVIYALLLPRLRSWGAFRATLNGALGDYNIHVPWILRLSTGIPLMGAGIAGYLFAPHFEVTARGVVPLMLTAAGFMLLVGVAVRLAALLALALWGFTLATRGLDALLVSELVVALVALTSLSAGRPSLDDLWSQTLPSAPRQVAKAGKLRVLLGPEPQTDVAMALTTWVPVVLRVGLGASLLYAGLAEKLLDPGPALAVAERFNLDAGPLEASHWVVGAGLTEVLLGVGLIVGVAVRPLSAAAFLVLTSTLFLIPEDPVVAHVSLWGLASVVFILGCGPWSVDRARMQRLMMGET